MKIMIKNRIIACIVLLLLYSCSEKPEFIKLDNVSIDGLKDSLIQVSMDYVVYNPNNVRTKLKQSGMSIYYNDTIVGKGYLDKQISLAPNDTIKVPIHCEVSLDKLSRFYPYLLRSDSTAFRIRGENKVGFLLKSFNIDVDDIIYLNTKNIILKEINKNLGNSDNFKIKTISVDALPTLNKTSFKINIASKNNLSFDYQINDIELEFFMDKRDRPIAHWKLQNPIWQKGHSTTEIPVNAIVDNFNALGQAKFSWLIKRKADFIVVGSAEIQIKEFTFNVPINDRMTMDLKKLLGF